MADPKCISVISLNVRGLRNENKRRSIYNYYRKRADILCLQETHCTDKDEKLWAAEWGGLAFFSNFSSAARGVCVLIKKGIPVIVPKVHKDEDGRVIVCHIQNINNEQDTFSIAAIYAPNHNDSKFFIGLTNLLGESYSQRLLIGDFNITFDDQLDRCNCFESKIKNKDDLTNLMKEWGLIDVWRVRNPNEKYYTWSKFQPNFVASRLDFALVNEGFATSITNVTHLTGIRTDHSAVYASIALKERKRGRGYWKLDQTMLFDKEVVFYY